MSPTTLIGRDSLLAVWIVKAPYFLTWVSWSVEWVICPMVWIPSGPQRRSTSVLPWVGWAHWLCTNILHSKCASMGFHIISCTIVVSICGYDGYIWDTGKPRLLLVIVWVAFGSFRLLHMPFKLLSQLFFSICILYKQSSISGCTFYNQTAITELSHF